MPTGLNNSPSEASSIQGLGKVYRLQLADCGKKTVVTGGKEQAVGTQAVGKSGGKSKRWEQAVGTGGGGIQPSRGIKKAPVHRKEMSFDFSL
ncbi:hypothetical protein N7540_012969 [Penicillium herquei]|nr:hypothetical protein N7540_012969 [Penicillium herquei]